MPDFQNPFVRGLLGARQAADAGTAQNIQNIGGLLGLRGQLQNQEFENQTRQALTQSGGDPDKALQLALQTGNVQAAQHLVPLVKMRQAEREAQSTVEGMKAINQMGKPQSPVAFPQMGSQSPGMGEPMPTMPSVPTQQPSQDARGARLQQLQAMSELPQYARNPVVQQRLQSEIDRLQRDSKPLIEHSFPVAGGKEPMVQPHISMDNGKTWQPIQGSQPTPKFARQIVNVNTGGGDAAQPTDDTLRMDAFRYLTDGTLPPNMGRGVQGATQATKIRNEASRIAKDEFGMPVDDIRMAQLTNKGQVAAIAQLGKARAQILQFEKTAEANLDLAVKASDKVDRTGVPVFNKWLQAGRTSIAGDNDTAVFNAANETFVNEYAKVMSGGYGAAATTEGAQQRAAKLLSTANTKEQYRAVTDQLKKEMGNRVRALDTQMEEERGRLRSGYNPKAASPSPSKEVDFGSLK